MGPYSELTPVTLAEILAPSALTVAHKFELNVDEWRFIGHPFSVQTAAFNIAFNVVFVLQVSMCPLYVLLIRLDRYGKYEGFKFLIDLHKLPSCI